MTPKDTLRLIRRLSLDLTGVASITSAPCFARYLSHIVGRLPSIIHTRTLAPADACMAGRPVRFRVFGTPVTLPGEIFGSAREIYARRVYFALPHFRIHPGDVVVDAGANRGVFTTFAACVARRVLAIEAQVGFRDVIRSHLTMNECPASVDIEFAIIGGETGALADGDVLTASSHYQGTPPPRRTLDDVLASHAVDHIDFLKLDIEGSEFDLFRSERRWLDRVSKLVMEVHSNFGDPRDLAAPLAAAGLQHVVFDADLKRRDSLGPDSNYLYAWQPDALELR
jgi:FkbM family methyltransferase